MAVLSELSPQRPVVLVAIVTGLLGLVSLLYKAFTNVYAHPLSKFPGPKLAPVSGYWRTWVEVIQGRSFDKVLEQLHSRYGDVVRVGPNELHFSNPQAYLDIYNNKNRWDKEWHLYHSFNEDESTFGFLSYRQSKQRKDVLNRMFAPKSIEAAQGLVVEKVNDLCKALKKNTTAASPASIFYAYRCYTIEIITYICFGTSIDAIEAPDYRAPILVAMDASIPIFTRFKHFEWYKNMILGCPPKISKVISPQTAGLVDLQTMVERQITDLVENPSHLAHLPHSMTIYHSLLDPTLHASGQIPSKLSLYQEAQSLMFAGADTSGNVLMVVTFHLLRQPKTMQKLKAELKAAWPVLSLDGSGSPDLKQLEKLPYLTAVLKEGLRITSGVITGLLRVVPMEGAVIAGHQVPGGTNVACGSTFVHYNAEIFKDPHAFIPERWIEKPELDTYLVAFGRGPRMCLGISLAWMELRLAAAHVFRRFDMVATADSPDSLPFHEHFLPFYYGPTLKTVMTPVTS